MTQETRYRLEIFVQGKGWRPVEELVGNSGIYGTMEDALKVGGHLIIDRMEKSSGTGEYGAKVGHPVGFKVSEIQTEIPPERLDEALKSLNWDEHKHKFFKHHENIYMLAKTWSWPD